MLSADSKRQQKALVSARFYDFNFNASHQVAVIRLLKECPTYSKFSKTWFRLNTNLVGLLRQEVTSSPCKILYANNDSNVVMLCEIPNIDFGEQEIRHFMFALSNKLNREYQNGQVAIGVGRRYEKYGELCKSYAEARRAANCAHLQESGVAYFEELGACRLIAYDSLHQEGKSFSDEVLLPLIECDEKTESSLLDTLNAYFFCNGNVSRMAEMLGIHYNTATNRIQRIQKLTGRSFDSFSDRFDFQIALLINRMWPV